MNVVVVESPAKAKTINKYLGSGYTVLASYGHVRDLPAKEGSVDTASDFAMIWEVDERAEKRLKEIAGALKGADHLYLATDPDREGEAISWHIAEELLRRKALSGVEVERVVFNEVTKSAVVEAFKQPRRLNQELIDAYMARRALDYLVGFTLSPVLWRKLPGSRSAGRVQSVALRLVCERESEIEAFKAQEYWTVEAQLLSPEGAPFTARLTHLDGRKLEKFDLGDEAAARQAVGKLEANQAFTVETVERREVRRNPQPPFTTSTLQQEASRKLGFGATRTMRIAQRLYEGVDLDGDTVGLITYMRTDGTQIAGEAIGAARKVIAQRFGDSYLPSTPRQYKTKAKNAQEAHEAIRPTDLARRPEQVARHLDQDSLRLYELIWTRTLASQMESARLDQVAIDIAGNSNRATLRANGSVVKFDGFFALYREGFDDPGDDERELRLPPLKEGDPVRCRKVAPEQHFTQPPPRFTEASLVKRLEELGIGRPSTYASILQVLQDRDYVRLDKKRFLPEDRGRLVTAFLSSFFERYFQYNFTADLEEQLDDISGGRKDWKLVLRQFWDAFSAAVEDTKDLSITNVIDALDHELGPHFFPSDPKRPGVDPRLCPACGVGRLGLKLGRNGGFIGCSGYPDCRFARSLGVVGDGDGDAEFTGPRELGEDPASGLPVTLRRGPFGIYIQLGDVTEDGTKPKRVSLPKNIAPDELTLEKALALLALPREIGRHPDTGNAVTAGIGRFGPYVRHGSTYRSLPADEDVLVVGLNRAVALLAEAKSGRGGAQALKTLGDHPGDGKPVTLHAGRYGPYVKHGKVNATLPKELDQDSVSLDAAVALIAAQAEKKKSKGGRKKANGGVKPEKSAASKSKSGTKKRAAPRKKKSEATAGEASTPGKEAD